VSGGLTAGWRNFRFVDPAVVEQALSVDVTTAKYSVAKFSTSSFRRNLLSWLEAD
jgi:hypothetical protein